MSRKKRNIKSGTWFQREMAMSKAYWALSGTAKGLLTLFLLKRDMDNQHNVINKNNITMTYKELENLHGQNVFGKPEGLSRASVKRGLDGLMAKGFIRVIHQGGAFQQDKTIFGLTDDWRHWFPGLVVEKRPPGKKASRPTHEKNFNPHNRTLTHPHNRNLKT